MSAGNFRRRVHRIPAPRNPTVAGVYIPPAAGALLGVYQPRESPPVYLKNRPFRQKEYGVQRVGAAPRRACKVSRAALGSPWASWRSSRRRRAIRLQTAAMYCLGVHAAPPVHLLRRPPTQAESGSAMPLVSSGSATTEIMRSVARRPQDSQTNMLPMVRTQL